MDSADGRSRNSILDDIIMRRRSCRAFSARVPPKELIMEIITAGMHAPYAALAVVGREDSRRFFVIEGFGEKMETIRVIIERRVQQTGEQLERKGLAIPLLLRLRARSSATDVTHPFCRS